MNIPLQLRLKTFLRHPSLLLAVVFTAAAAAEPPKVIKTVPESGARDVDPGLKELRIIFDQPMSPDGMSIVGGGPKFPKLGNEKRWEDPRTFVFKWELEPDHDYWLSVNSERFTKFRGVNGEPCVPYPLSFHTGAKTGSPSTAKKELSTATNEEAIARLQRAIEKDYSYRDLRNVNWSARFQQFAPRLRAAATPDLFASLAAELLSPAQDIHLLLQVAGKPIGTHTRNAPWNVDLSILPRVVPHWKEQSSIVSSGLFADGSRYVGIRSWPTSPGSELEPALAVLAEAARAGKPLIIDVRANGGGAELTAQEFAGCFLRKKAVYARNATLRAGEWLGPFDRTIEPKANRPAFHGRSIVLMGQGTISSSESFVMMMKQAPGCTLIGDRTAGSSGNPKPADLGNGVLALIPSWKALRLDGTCIEGEGFAPDLEVKAGPKDFQGGDPVLKAALRSLQAAK
jgi:hypothetical protein